MDDPQVAKLADNSDLARALIVTIIGTATGVALMKDYTATYFMEQAFVITGMNVGATLGFLWYNFCPNQSNIRELISARKTASNENCH